MNNFHIVINITNQKLFLYNSHHKEWINGDERWGRVIRFQPIFSTLISSAENGVGQKNNSFQTPLGRHKIRAMIGKNEPINSVFKGRRITGEIWNSNLSKKFPNRDWILTRILWLSGLENGHNRFGDVDTMKRYVYIHGSPPNVEMGKTGSKGCIRMNANDVIKLFDLITVGTTVNLIL